MKPLILNFVVERQSADQVVKYSYDYDRSLNTVTINNEIKDVVDIAHSYFLETFTKVQGERDDFSVQKYEMRRISESKGERDKCHYHNVDWAIQTRTKGESSEVNYLALELTTKTFTHTERDDESSSYIQ